MACVSGDRRLTATLVTAHEMTKEPRMVANGHGLEYDVSNAAREIPLNSANGLAVGQTQQSRVATTLKKPNKNRDSETSQVIGR